MNGSDQPKTKLLLADANILIDLAKAGGLGLIGDLVRFGLAEIFIPRVVYDEVEREVTETQVADLGITILSVAEELTEQALAYPDERLSPQDRVLLLMAVENGYGAWTNDKKLRANCKLKNVPIYWEFEILRELVANGHLAKDALVSLARKVDECNPYQKGVADDLGGSCKTMRATQFGRRQTVELRRAHGFATTSIKTIHRLRTSGTSVYGKI